MLDGPGMFACGTTLGPRPTKVDEDESGADPPVRAGPPGPALSSTSRRGRRLRTRGAAPPASLTERVYRIRRSCSLSGTPASKQGRECDYRDRDAIADRIYR